MVNKILTHSKYGAVKVDHRFNFGTGRTGNIDFLNKTEFNLLKRINIAIASNLIAGFGDEYEDKKNRIFLDYPELDYTEEDIVPVLGGAGDLIIFDTDVFHMGGVVKEGFERLLIRGHTR